VRRKAVAQNNRDKMYRSISEVSEEIGVKPHVLRYWETQFPTLRPRKNRAGNRMYRPEELELLGRIKELLYDRRFTIEGARRHLLEERRGKPHATKETPAAKAATLSAEHRKRVGEVCRDLGRISRALRQSAGSQSATRS
jgi:DNA-binding transcriptional MerR regulator